MRSLSAGGALFLPIDDSDDDDSDDSGVFIFLQQW